jgi:glycosyltransferase involved in cell wall biosynthesis
MKSNYLVSVIMTCHNGELYLRNAIDSLLQQTYTEWELIFYDNYSNDRSLEIIKNYKDKRIKYFKSYNLVKLGTIRKLAIEKCKGLFISFLDVDDYWSADKIEKQIDKFKSNENIDIVYSNYNIIENDQIKKIKKKLFKGKCQKEIILSYINRLPLTAWLTLMIKRNKINQLDYSFDTNLHICSDFDLIIRLSDFCNFDFVEDYLCFYRVHNNNESKQNKKEVEELNYILLKYRNNKNLFRVFNKQNFADRIVIKNFLYKKIANQPSDSIAVCSGIYKIVYFIIKILPISLLQLFNQK